MTDKQLEIIKKLNKIQSSIEPMEKNFKTIQNIQKSINYFNKITPLSETLRSVEKFRECLKPIRATDIGLLSIIEKDKKCYQSPLSETLRSIEKFHEYLKPIRATDIGLLSIIEKDKKCYQSPLSETLRSIEKFHEYLKPIRATDIGLLPIIEKHSRYYQSPLSEIIKKQVELRNRIEQNLFFNSIWRGTPIENTLENQESIETEAKEFASDVLELTSHIPDQEIEKSIPVDEILKEINEVSETPIDKNSLSTAIGFMYASSCSEDDKISNVAKEILAELGKFSESAEGKGLAFLIVLMTFLKTLLS